MICVVISTHDGPRHAFPHVYTSYLVPITVFCLSTVDHLMQVLDLNETSCAGRRSSPGVSARAEWTRG